MRQDGGGSGEGALFEMIGVNATVDGNKNFVGMVSEIGVYRAIERRTKREYVNEEERNVFESNRIPFHGDLRKIFSKIGGGNFNHSFHHRGNFQEKFFPSTTEDESILI